MLNPSDKKIFEIDFSGNLSLLKTFNCGQCFRFETLDGGSSESVSGIAQERSFSISHRKSSHTLQISGLSESDAGWISDFLSLNENYGEYDYDIIESVPEKYRDVTAKAICAGKGIRILKQDPWETLISFIISQNNNIPRIKKNVSSVCSKYGKQTASDLCFFPSVDEMKSATEQDLNDLKLGFRSRYIIDAIKKIGDGSVDFDHIKNTADYELCEKQLTQICGVGVKVAACTLLFGLNRIDAFPVDIWMKRILAKYYDTSVDGHTFGSYAGIAQEYLYYFARTQN